MVMAYGCCDFMFAASMNEGEFSHVVCLTGVQHFSATDVAACRAATCQRPSVGKRVYETDCAYLL